MDPTTFSAILEALDSRREVEERRREERYTALIERVGMGMTAAATGPVMSTNGTLREYVGGARTRKCWIFTPLFSFPD
ncbi:UNVERIFIED_CONTAM: hypothetical protein FKN15_023642 [Acipenser sinensis]